MPQSRQRRTSRTQPIDHRLVIATSLQEAAVWLHQAEVSLLEIDDPAYAKLIGKMVKNLRVIHNRYSRIKTP